MDKGKIPLLCLLFFIQTQVFVYPACAGSVQPVQGKNKIVAPMFLHHSDPNSSEIAPDAVQMVGLLGLQDKLKRIIAINDLGGAMTGDLQLESHGLKYEVLESVEETRLQMDFVVAEIDEELSFLEEALRFYQDDRDNRVMRANLHAFRTNGALWSVAEALDIPTYKTPKLSIPSGIVGIIAGIIPSVFSEYAIRKNSGEKYERAAYPNILTGMFDLPMIPRVTFPEVVLKYLDCCPEGETRTRKEILRQRWQSNKNMRCFRGGLSQSKLMLLTGNVPYTSDIDFCQDRVIMLTQVRTVIMQMSRPLLEICQAVRGKKRFAESSSSL